MERRSHSRKRDYAWLPQTDLVADRLRHVLDLDQQQFHEMLCDHSQTYIDLLNLQLPPYEEFNWRTQIFYMFSSNDIQRTLREYEAYITSGAVLAVTQNPAQTASVIEARYRDIFPSLRRENIKRWFNSNQPTGSYPFNIFQMQHYEKRNPYSFDQTSAELFMNNGFGSLLSLCFTNAGPLQSAIAGQRSGWQFRLVGLLTGKVDSQLEDLHIAKRRKSDLVITNLLIARYLECFQKPETAKKACDTLSDKTVCEFLLTTLRTLQERHDGKKVREITFSAKFGLNRFYISWLYDQLEKRKLTEDIPMHDMPSCIYINFRRGQRIPEMIKKLEEEFISYERAEVDVVQKLREITVHSVDQGNRI
jgi:hypothetical protein